MKLVSLMLLLFCGLLVNVVSAQQLKVIDITYVHNMRYKWFYNPSGVTNWVTPKAYSKGTFYVRMQVTGMQGASITLQPAFFGGAIDDAHAAATWHQTGFWTFPKNETRIYAHPFSGLWAYSNPDWTNVVNVMIIDQLTNGTAGPTVRFEMYVVAPGDVFTPPSHWGVTNIGSCTNYCVEKIATAATTADVQKIAATPSVSWSGKSFTLAESSRNATISLFDLRGRNVAQTELNRANNRWSPSVKKGMYLMRSADNASRMICVGGN